MSVEYEVGKVVVLKSGGPKMVIEGWWKKEEKLVNCVWLEGSAKQSALFKLELLESP